MLQYPFDGPDIDAARTTSSRVNVVHMWRTAESFIDCDLTPLADIATKSREFVCLPNIERGWQIRPKSCLRQPVRRNEWCQQESYARSTRPLDTVILSRMRRAFRATRNMHPYKHLLECWPVIRTELKSLSGRGWFNYTVYELSRSSEMGSLERYSSFQRAHTSTVSAAGGPSDLQTDQTGMRRSGAHAPYERR